MRIEPFSREAAQDRSPGWSEAEAWVRTRAAPTCKCCHIIWHTGRGKGVQENNLSILTVDRSVLRGKKYSDLGKPNH